MKASIIILSWNGIKYLEACLNAVLAQEYSDFEVIVVDNASSDNSANFVAANFPQVKLIQHSRNLGFSGGMNAGTRIAAGEIVVWLNQDTIVQKQWLPTLAAAFKQADVGVAGCKILEADGKTLNHAGGTLDINAGETCHFGAGEPDRGQYDQPADVEYVTGAAMAARKEVLNQVGLLDEQFFPGYYEDADYCVRVRNAGYKIRYNPEAVLIHHVSAGTHDHWHRRRFYYYRNRLLFVLKYLSAAEFQTQFLPLEQHNLEKASFGELYAAQLALSDVLVRSEGQAVQNALVQLQNLIVFLRSNAAEIAPLRNALNENRSHKFGLAGIIMPRLESLDTAWKIKDHTFRSTVPLVGGAIAALRTMWNAVSAKWYVLALFQQQMKFNHLTTKIIQAMAAYIWDNESTLTLLEERYSRLKQQIADLEASIRQKNGDL